MFMQVEAFLAWLYNIIAVAFFIFLVPGLFLLVASDYLERSILNQMEIKGKTKQENDDQPILYNSYQSHSLRWDFMLNMLKYLGVVLLGLFGYSVADFLGLALFVAGEILFFRYRFRYFKLEDRFNSRKEQ